MLMDLYRPQGGLLWPPVPCGKPGLKTLGMRRPQARPDAWSKLSLQVRGREARRPLKCRGGPTPAAWRKQMTYAFLCRRGALEIGCAFRCSRIGSTPSSFPAICVQQAAAHSRSSVEAVLERAVKMASDGGANVAPGSIGWRTGVVMGAWPALSACRLRGGAPPRGHQAMPKTLRRCSLSIRPWGSNWRRTRWKSAQRGYALASSVAFNVCSLPQWGRPPWARKIGVKSVSR